jgi:hypothetical protein
MDKSKTAVHLEHDSDTGKVTVDIDTKGFTGTFTATCPKINSGDCMSVLSKLYASLAPGYGAKPESGVDTSHWSFDGDKLDTLFAEIQTRGLTYEQCLELVKGVPASSAQH